MRIYVCSLALALALSAGPVMADGPVHYDTTVGASHAAPNASSSRATVADRLFDAGKWQEAALALDAVRRDAMSSRTERERAELRLAIALHSMGLLQASYACFSEIAEKPNHLEFDATLLWLAQLAMELPEPADVIERVGKYTRSHIDGRTRSTPTLRAELEYLLGRYKYRNHEYDQALDLFAAVDRNSKYWASSRLYAGITNVQLRRAGPAGNTFRAILDSSTTKEDALYVRDLARMSLARLDYSASIRIDEHGQTNIDAHLLGAAVRRWGAIDASSEFWLDALFEQSWAYFMAGDYSRALGNLHTLQAPFFPHAYYPEADVLRALIYFTECHYEDAAVIITSMQRQYLPIHAEVEKILARYSGDDQQESFFRFLQKIRRDRERGTHDAGLSKEIEPIVRHSLADRQLARHIDYVELLDRESSGFAHMDAAFRDTPLGADIKDTLELSRDVALRNATALARERCLRSLDELGEQLRGGSRLLVEIAKQLGPAAATGGASHDASNVVRADSEHVLWEFQGEYWRDEIGTYRQSIVSKCAR